MKCDPINPPEIPSYIFQMAESFSAAVNAVAHATSSTAGIDGEQINLRSLLIVPQIVNESFSVELYLKCLHAIRSCNTVPYGHNLLELFQALGVQQKAIVRRHFSKVQATNRVTVHRANILGNRALPTIEKTLEKSDRAFERFRYVWENDNRVEGFDLMNVRVALREAIIGARPDFTRIVQKMSMVATAFQPCGPNCRGVLAHIYQT